MEKKGAHWKKEWGKWRTEFFLCPPFPPFPVNKHRPRWGDVSFRACCGFFLCVYGILCCFQSVRTVGRVQECGSMVRHKQVRLERVGKESLSELSGNWTGTCLLKSTLTLGTNYMSTTVAARANVARFTALHHQSVAVSVWRLLLVDYPCYDGWFGRHNNSFDPAKTPKQLVEITVW